jgi:Fe-S oxidoreductase
VKRIVTACPHCFNVIKNEYPALGGSYEVMHHTQLLQSLVKEGRLKIEGSFFKGKRITYHDSCYLGRANGVYEAPRQLIENLEADFEEMERSRSNGLCCGAGGAQMFKEDEPGDQRINLKRTDEALEKKPDIVAVKLSVLPNDDK